MAPSHLIFKWQREIERLFPDAKAVVLQDFEDVLNIEKEVTCALRNYPLFMIISKDSAKINYQERPSAIWDARNHQFMPELRKSDYVRRQLYLQRAVKM